MKLKQITEMAHLNSKFANQILINNQQSYQLYCFCKELEKHYGFFEQEKIKIIEKYKEEMGKNNTEKAQAELDLLLEMDIPDFPKLDFKIDDFVNATVLQNKFGFTPSDFEIITQYLQAQEKGD